MDDINDDKPAEKVNGTLPLQRSGPRNAPKDGDALRLDSEERLREDGLLQEPCSRWAPDPVISRVKIPPL